MKPRATETELEHGTYFYGTEFTDMKPVYAALVAKFGTGYATPDLLFTKTGALLPLHEINSVNSRVRLMTVKEALAQIPTEFKHFPEHVLREALDQYCGHRTCTYRSCLSLGCGSRSQSIMSGQLWYRRKMLYIFPAPLGEGLQALSYDEMAAMYFKPKKKTKFQLAIERVYAQRAESA